MGNVKKRRVRIAALVLAAAVLLTLAAVSAAATPKRQLDLGAVGKAAGGKQAGTINFSPPSVVAGSGAFALTMTLSGAHAAVPTWTVNWIGPTGSDTLSVASSTTASVVANVPASLVVSAGPVSVAVSDGTNDWVGSSFTITPPGPTLTGIVPATATNSTASAPFTLSGANLLSAGSSSTVTLRTEGSVVATASVSSRTATTIDGAFGLASPTVPAGTYNVVLSGSGLSATLPNGFTVTGPTLTSITPSSGVNSNASLAFTLAGSGLSGLYSPIVTLRSGTTVSATATGLNAAPSGVSMTGSFNLASPVVPAGSYDVVLSYGSGASIRLTNAFTVANPGLVISSISPTTVYAGSVQPNLTLSVTGSGFVPAPATAGGVGSRVQIGSRVATDTVFVSATEIRTTLLPTDIAVAGTVPVRVVNPTPGGGTSLPVDLTVATDTIAPVTTISGADDAWHNSDVVLTVAATDSQSGLQNTRYTIDASVPAVLSAGTITVPANGSYEGANVVTAWSTDWCNHMENPGPAVTVKIDTVRPKAYGKTARGTHHGKKITLKFKIEDGLSDKAESVWVRIVNPKHRIVQTRHFSRSVSMNEWYSFKWRAVSRGTYKYYVHGSDLAGNRSTTSAKKIIVK